MLFIIESIVLNFRVNPDDLYPESSPVNTHKLYGIIPSNAMLYVIETTLKEYFNKTGKSITFDYGLKHKRHLIIICKYCIIMIASFDI